MEENHSLKAPKEEKEEEEERPIPKLHETVTSISVINRFTDEFVLKKMSSQSETLGAVSFLNFSPEKDNLKLASCVSSSGEENFAGLDVKPTIATPLASFDPLELKAGIFRMSHQEVLASVTAQAHGHMQLQTEGPLSAAETSSVPSATSVGPLHQRLPALKQDKNVSKPEVDLEDSSDQEPKLALVKTPTNDEFNWRKYGQKLVKSSESSRSYYRCTTIGCFAKKKVERCDRSGNVIEIIYKGQHNHDPPQKIRSTKRFASSVLPVLSAGTGRLSEAIDCPVRLVIDSDPSALKREARQAAHEMQLHSSECEGAISNKAEEELFDEPHSKEHLDEPLPKKRMKGRSDTYSTSMLTTVKEPKVVVQAPGDVGVSGDGYRWRKYGQKMVKGNPNPRSYFKCTSAGCPVRKHVERATDDTAAIIITYEGKHDHDMPVPKKRHGPPPSAALLIAAAAAAMNSSQPQQSEDLTNHQIPSQWSVDTEDRLTDENTSEHGGDKPLEPTRTLLSIGIELRPY